MATYKPLIMDAAGKLQKLAATDVLAVGSLAPAAIVMPPPKVIAYASTMNLDTSVANDFAVGPLTASGGVINFTGAPSGPELSGRQGSILVRQDATGSRTLFWTMLGNAISANMWAREQLTADVQPQPLAWSYTLYNYWITYFPGIGSPALVLTRTFLTTS